MKKRRRYEDYGSLSELNVTPFLGLAFTLLVIAIVTFPLLGRAGKTAPAFFTPNRGPLVAGDIHVLGIGKNRSLTWNGKPTTRAALSDALRALKPEADRCGIIIEADRALPVQEAANLLNLISTHGIRKASLVTTPAAAPSAAVAPKPADNGARASRPLHPKDTKPVAAPPPARIQTPTSSGDNGARASRPLPKDTKPVAAPPPAAAKQP